MARKKPELNVWQRRAEELFRASYNRDAGRVLYSEHDVEHRYLEEIGVDANGNRYGEWQTEPVTNPVLMRWIDALMAFDDRDHHDAAPLIALLDADIEMLPVVGIWLTDLIRRHVIECDHGELRHSLASALKSFKPSPKKGRPKVPAYDMTTKDAELHIDNQKVTSHLRENGGTVDDAIMVVPGKKYPRDPAMQERYALTLRNFREGRRTSSRQAAKRRS